MVQSGLTLDALELYFGAITSSVSVNPPGGPRPKVTGKENVVEDVWQR